MKIFSRIFSFLLIVVYIISVIYLIVNWSRMGDVIGVHFGLNGVDNYIDFDVFDNKIYSLYPYVINGIILFIVIIVNRKIDKLKIGLHVNEKGESFLKQYIKIFLYIIAFSTFVFFTSWQYCVINQCHMYVFIPVLCALIIVVDLFSILPILLFIKLFYGIKDNKSLLDKWNDKSIFMKVVCIIDTAIFIMIIVLSILQFTNVLDDIDFVVLQLFIIFTFLNVIKKWKTQKVLSLIILFFSILLFKLYLLG